YAGIVSARLSPDRAALSAIVVCGVSAFVGQLLGGANPADALAAGMEVGVISFTVYALFALGRSYRELSEAREELARLAVTNERNRIARDLHDTLGHSLSLIALKSELAGRLLPDQPERARTEVNDVERVARESLAAVRETVRGYRTPTLHAELD